MPFCCKKIGNSLLVLGVLVLGWYLAMMVTGADADPLMPALSALLIGCTAVLDRVGNQEAE